MATEPGFCIVGAGAIGSFLGAALARGGAAVVLVARGPQLDALRDHGVRVLSPKGDFAARVDATDDLAAVSEADRVVLTVKAPSLIDLLPHVAPLLKPSAVVLPAQNGVPWWFFEHFDGPLTGETIQSVDPGGVIRDTIDPARVVGCVTFPAAELVEPGVVRHVEGTRFTIGEIDGRRSARAAEIARAFMAGGLRCPVHERIRDELWLKLIGNASFNPVSTLTRATLGELGLLSEVTRLLRDLMTEVAKVGERLGLTLRVSIDRRLEAGLAVGNHRSSMLQDLDAGRVLEVEALMGSVVEIAGRVDVEVPRLRAVAACVRLLELESQRAHAVSAV